MQSSFYLWGDPGSVLVHWRGRHDLACFHDPEQALQWLEEPTSSMIIRYNKVIDEYLMAASRLCFSFKEGGRSPSWWGYCIQSGRYHGQDKWLSVHLAHSNPMAISVADQWGSKLLPTWVPHRTEAGLHLLHQHACQPCKQQHQCKETDPAEQRLGGLRGQSRVLL